VATAAVLAAPPAVQAKVDCLSRDGRCMAVRVNGQASVKMSKQTKKKLAELLRPGRGTPWSGQLRYELPGPIDGRLDFDARPLAGAESWFGAGPRPSAMLYALDPVKLETRSELSASDSVRAGGAAVVTQREVLEQERLPAGRYILSIDLNGASNWDRHLVYFEVK
jgi:hypothetical protein